MPKGYWIPQIDVSNPEGYKAYMAATPPAHEKYRGTALVRGGTMEVMEGRARARNVMREFPDYATALACYRSPEYQRARPLRLPHAQCDFLDRRRLRGAAAAASGSPPAAAARKGYWIAQIDVTDPEGYKPYTGGGPAAVGQFGARYLVRGGAREVTEGKVRSRTVVMEFPSYDAALACYRSPDYQAAKSSATARPRSISSSSKATTARSSDVRRTCNPAALYWP